jgi:hypothetical protein
LVESGDHAGAIAHYYTEDSSMQENSAPPRVGRDVLVAHGRVVLARMSQVHSKAISSVMEGDRVVGIMTERDYHGEPALCPISVKDPASQPLSAIGELIERASTAPLESLKEFRRWKRIAGMPRPLRRLLWWMGLNIGRQRGNFFGTFAVSVYSALNAESLHPLSTYTALLNYGVIDGNGHVAVRIIYDHRVMDGATVARALQRMEEILKSVVLEEVQSLPRAAARTDGQPAPKTATGGGGQTAFGTSRTSQDNTQRPMTG